MEAWADRLNALGGKGEPFFFLVDFEQEAPRVWSAGDEGNDHPRFSFRDYNDPGPVPEGMVPPHLTADHVGEADFRRAFNVVQAGLRRGDSFLTNLTFPIPVRLNCSLEEVYWQSDSRYRIYWPGHFVCFSPETFVTISKTGYIESRPMKGTALDTEKASTALLNSRKEIAEHATIVDLIRNDLSRVAKGVRVTDYRYFHKIATSRRGLIQTSSNIGGQLTHDWRARIGTTLQTLLPAGSISGAPKPATLDIIRRAEGQPRGYYCGIGGYFDGEQLDTCVLIRLIEERTDGTLYFRSGGGITARSEWEEEYAELRDKVRIPSR
jgi:para-aminobenzoate synthetase component 1